MHEGALLAKAVGMVAHAHYHHLGMVHQAGDILLGIHSILHHEKLGDEGIARHEGHGIIGEYGIGVGSAVPYGEIHNVFLVGRTLGGKVLANVDIVGGEVGIELHLRRCRKLCDDDGRHVGAADILHRVSGTTLGAEPVELGRSLGGNHHVAVALCDIVNQMTCHGNLCLGLLGERHAYGVAYAVGEQCPYAHGALDASVLALAGLGHSQVQWIVHVLLVHLAHQQAHRAHHHHGVACLDGDDHIIELLLLAYTQEFHAALDDALGGVAISRHDAVGERAVVDTDAHCGVVCAADVEEGHESLLKSLELGGIFLVGVFYLLERACGVDIVSGVHPHLLGIEGCHVGHIGIEMHVGHEGSHDALGAQCGIDVLEVLCLAHALCGEAHVFSSCLDYPLGLCHRGFGVGGVGGGHRLNAHRVAAAQQHVAHGHGLRLDALIFEKRVAIGCRFHL